MSDCRSCHTCPESDERLESAGRRAFVARTLPALLAAAGLATTASRLDAFTTHVVDAVMLPAGERAFAIPSGDAVLIDRDSAIILVRRGNQVFAFARACPHEQAELRWRDADGRFQCPRHESKYQPDGTRISGRATRNMDRLPVRRDGQTIVVDPSAPIRSDQRAADWAAAIVTV
jgi:nitrite reductase/ring-hydroxylating ferredoxin subunit